MLLESSNTEEIRLYTEQDRMVHQTQSGRAVYSIRKNDVYVRAELFGRGKKKAWTQPVFIDNKISEEKIKDSKKCI